MIRPEKQEHALYALHLILTRARFMALQKEEPADIAELLDYAEMLPRLIASREDATETFREYLVAVAQRFPFLRYALDKFDAPDTPERW